MHIGILQTGYAPDAVAEKHGGFFTLFSKLLEGQGLTFSNWNVVDMNFPESVHAADGWLLTGSKHGAYEDHPFIPPLEDFIREVHAKQLPMIGICFGHQIIAQALGGKVMKFDGGWAVGHHEYEFNDLGAIALNAWHQDQVVSLPPDAKRIASSDFCENAALVYGDHIMTMQPHPELPNHIIRTYLDVRGPDPRYPRPLIAKAEELANTPHDEPRVANLIANFLKAARAKAAV